MGNEEGHILLYAQTTDNLVAGALHDLNHHRLLDMFVATGHIRHLHTVAIHRRHRVALCDKHRGAATIGLERVTPTGLAMEHALLHLCLQVQAI